MEGVEVVSAPARGLHTTTVVVCVTVVVLFVLAGFFYLEARERSTMATTQLVMNVLAALPGLLAYLQARKSTQLGEVVAERTNGHLAHQTELASRALGALPPARASAIVHEVADASPVDDPARTG